jgi:hypothetical protein
MISPHGTNIWSLHAVKSGQRVFLAILTGRLMSLKSVTATIDGIITAAALVVLTCALASFDFPHPIEIVAAGCVVLAGIGVFHWMQYRQRSQND